MKREFEMKEEVKNEDVDKASAAFDKLFPKK